MPEPQHPTHTLVPSQPGAEPHISIANALDQRDGEGDSAVDATPPDDTLDVPRPAEGGIETPPPKAH